MVKKKMIVNCLMVAIFCSAAFLVGPSDVPAKVFAYSKPINPDATVNSLPTDSTKNTPVKFSEKGIPKEYSTPEVLKIIKDYEQGKITIDSAPYDHTVKGVWETWDGKGGVMEVKTGKVSKQGEYAWKFLSDPIDGVPMGISVRFGPYDNTPHYHNQGEAFYVLEGECLLNINGEFRTFKKGDFVYFEGNAIHDMVVVKSGPFAHFWWYPNDSDWGTFKYYNKGNTKDNPEIQQTFERVDQMRLNMKLAPRSMTELPEGVYKVGEWWEKTNGGKNL